MWQLCTDVLLKNNEKGLLFSSWAVHRLLTFRIGKIPCCRKRVCFLQICYNAVIRELNENLVKTELPTELQKSRYM